MRSLQTTRFMAACLVWAALGATLPQQSLAQGIELFPDEPEQAPAEDAAKAPRIQISSQGLSAQGAGAVVLKFKRRGASMFVETKVHGKRAFFLVDTGASTSTLTPSFARKIGALPDSRAPTMVVQTANGRRRTSLGLMRSLRFGGRTHRNVTFSLCPSCGGRSPWGAPVVGLLGMNVLGRYTMSIDEARGTIKLVPGLGFSNRRADVRHWVKLKPLRVFQARKSKKMFLEVAVMNRSKSSISSLEVLIQCEGSNGLKESSASDSVGPGASKRIRIPWDSGCKKQSGLDIKKATW